MIRRIASLPRPASLLRAARPARSFTSPSAPALGLNSSNVVLELDAKKVATEIKKRGLASSIGSSSGMDRVSLFDPPGMPLFQSLTPGHHRPPPLLPWFPPRGRAIPPHLHHLLQDQQQRRPPRGQVRRPQVRRFCPLCPELDTNSQDRRCYPHQRARGAGSLALFPQPSWSLPSRPPRRWSPAVS